MQTKFDFFPSSLALCLELVGLGRLEHLEIGEAFFLLEKGYPFWGILSPTSDLLKLAVVKDSCATFCRKKGGKEGINHHCWHTLLFQ